MTYEPVTSEPSVRVVRKDPSRQVFAARATIFAEGEVGTIAYILLHGDVTVFVGFGPPQQRNPAESKPGQMFGAYPLMADARRATSALTIRGCEPLAVGEAKLRQKLDEADPLLRYWGDYRSKRVIDLSSN